MPTAELYLRVSEPEEGSLDESFEWICSYTSNTQPTRTSFDPLLPDVEDPTVSYIDQGQVQQIIQTIKQVRSRITVPEEDRFRFFIYGQDHIDHPGQQPLVARAIWHSPNGSSGGFIDEGDFLGPEIAFLRNVIVLTKERIDFYLDGIPIP